MNPITVFLTIACLIIGAALGAVGYLYLGIAIVFAAVIIASALKMANTWEKFVILRAGKLRGVKGPGLFLIIPVIDRVVTVIDERIHPTALQLRAMNIIYETTKERGATILMPTSMVDSMNPAVALALAGQQTAPQKANGPLPLTTRPQ
jgi:hypothetical protein